jgi:DNA replication and repair protein RecF
MLPDIADLVFEGPASRRSWLDWGTFHVKHEYLSRLRRYLRAVRQRNAALKQGPRSPEVRAWSEKVSDLGAAVDADRQEFMVMVAPYIQRVLSALAPELELDVAYHRGWGADDDLAKLLGESSEREVKYGSTLWGPHRADVRLRAGGVPAASMLSRGQGKMVASALKIGQAALVAERENKATVFLIDDAGAELDVAHNLRFFELLREIGGQILATTTRSPGSDESLDPFFAPRSGEPDANSETTAMFHVEHGRVSGEGKETE